MRVIYEPKGRAREYAELAINVYTGCTHGCKYCYVPAIARQEQSTFASKGIPRKDILRHLDSDIETMLASKDTRRVTLSFMSDPFQPCEEQYGISCAVVRALKKANIPVDILTKGGHRAESALPFLGVSDAVGTTLTFSQADKCAEWEPGAAPPRERAAFLKAAKEAGIQTWVSIEPVIDTQESLECIRRTAEYVDKYKVGRLNHMTNTTDWRQFTQDAFALLTTLGKKYMFKHDLRPYLLSGQAAQQD